MQKMSIISIVVAGVSLVIGIIVRLANARFLFGLTANALLRFTDTALLFALAFGLLQLLRTKKEG